MKKTTTTSSCKKTSAAATAAAALLKTNKERLRCLAERAVALVAASDENDFYYAGGITSATINNLDFVGDHSNKFELTIECRGPYLMLRIKCVHRLGSAGATFYVTSDGYARTLYKEIVECLNIYAKAPHNGAFPRQRKAIKALL